MIAHTQHTHDLLLICCDVSPTRHGHLILRASELEELVSCAVVASLLRRRIGPLQCFGGPGAKQKNWALCLGLTKAK